MSDKNQSKRVKRGPDRKRGGRGRAEKLTEGDQGLGGVSSKRGIQKTKKKRVYKNTDKARQIADERSKKGRPAEKNFMGLTPFSNFGAHLGWQGGKDAKL